MSFKPQKIIFLALILLFSIVAAVFLAEHTLLFMGKQRRQANLDYGDTWRPDGLGRGGYLKENLDVFVVGGTGKVRWRNNASGFRHDRETTEQPAQGTLRILSLGDSFTAGYRVAQEETYSYLLEDWLNRNYGKAEVLISCIDEPATGLYYLERSGVRFHPQVVLLGITLGNDITHSYLSLDPRGDYLLNPEHEKFLIEKNQVKDKIGFRRGLEKFFIPDDYLQTRGPLEEWLYRTRRWLNNLRLVKSLRPDEVAITSWYEAATGAAKPPLFDAVNGLGVFTDPAPPEIQEAYRRFFRILDGFNTFCEQRGIFLALLLFPQRFQVNPADWDRAVEKYGLNKSRFDLLAPNKKIAAFCRQRSIFCIDPTEAMAAQFSQTGTKMYYPLGDMHWNREGHRVFFESARASLDIVAAKGFAALRAGDSGRIPLKKTGPQ